MNGNSLPRSSNTSNGIHTSRLDDDLILEGLSGMAPIDPSHIDDVFNDAYNDDLKPPSTKPSHRLFMRRNSYDFSSMSEAVRGAFSEPGTMRYPINNIQYTRPSLLSSPLAAAETSAVPYMEGDTNYRCFEPISSDQQLQAIVADNDTTIHKHSRAFDSQRREVDDYSWQPRYDAYFAAPQPQRQLYHQPQINQQQQKQQQHSHRQRLHSVHGGAYTTNNHEPLPLNWSSPASFAQFNSGASTNVTLSVANEILSLHPRISNHSGACGPQPHFAVKVQPATPQLQVATLSVVNSSSSNYPIFDNHGGVRGHQFAVHVQPAIPQLRLDVPLSDTNFHASLTPPLSPSAADVSVAPNGATLCRHRNRDDMSNEDETSTDLSLPPAAAETSSTPKTKACHKRREKKSKVNDPNAPDKALTAYNFFYRFERDRLLEFSRSESSIDAPEDLPDEYFAYHAWTPNNSLSEQREMLENQWHRDRSVKRKHTKTHGRISFASLTRRIAASWKALPPPVKDVFRDIARKDAHRYARELSKYETTKPVSL